MAKLKVRKNGSGDKISSFFRGLPMVDATEPLRITISKADARTGKRLDPNNCVFAKACKRLFGSQVVLFLRGQAYVELTDSKGLSKVYRYYFSPLVKEQIAVFDKTGTPPEGGFVLSPPSPSRKLATMRERQREYSEDVRLGRRTPKRSPSRACADGVRDGRSLMGELKHAIENVG